MFRKCSNSLAFRASVAQLFGFKQTSPSLIGRRKFESRLDGSEFMRRANVGGQQQQHEEDMLEGNSSTHSDEDYSSFLAARKNHLGKRGIDDNFSSHSAHLKPIRGDASSSQPPSSSMASSSSSLKGKGKRIVVNAGGRKFETYEGTLLQHPKTAFGEMILEQITSSGDGTLEAYQNSQAPVEIFLDVDPNVFNFIMQFLRSGKIVLPTDDEPLRFAINGALKDFGLLDIAFPPQGVAAAEMTGDESAEEPVPLVRLPDVCVIQMCDHLQHDQGVKRHALNISYGSDGFLVRELCKKIRKDLNGQLSNTYWQCYQTHERSMFLITTKIANGTADLMMASVTQRLIEHTEQTMGYRLVSSYVTLSPDIKNTNVRLFIHNLIFRRVRNPSIEDTDAIQLFSNPDGSISAAMGVVSGMQHEMNKRNHEDATFVPNEEMFKNFEPPSVGPQDSYGKLGMPLTAPPGQRVPGNLWDE